MPEIKVKCKVCVNETNEVCSVKKCKVKTNKSRACEAFIYEPTKVKLRTKLHSEYIPFYIRDKNARKEMIAKMEAEKIAQQAKEAARYIDKTANPDCLANFRSSAANE